MGHFVWDFFAFNFSSILRVANTQHGLKMVTAKITFPVISTVCIKKRLVFEIQISHNYSDLIVLK